MDAILCYTMVQFTSLLIFEFGTCFVNKTMKWLWADVTRKK